MNPETTKTLSQQTPEKQALDPDSLQSFKKRFSTDAWEKYLKNPSLNQYLAKLTPKELKAFWQNSSRFCNQAITRKIKKDKEAAKKFKESIEGK